MLFDRLRLARSVAVGVAIHGDRVLLMRGGLPGAEEAWWHVPGGPIDFGVRAHAPLPHAYREEVGCDVTVDELMGVSQHPFLLAGAQGREMVFQYLVRLVDAPVSLLPGADGHTTGDRQDLAWVPLAEVVAGIYDIAPAGFVERLVDWLNRRVDSPPAEQPVGRRPRSPRLRLERLQDVEHRAT